MLTRSLGEIGNGRATAILLARQGAKVALLDVNTEWVEETKRMITAEGGISEVVECDVTNEESCKAAVARTVTLFGAVHILVNIGEYTRYVECGAAAEVIKWALMAPMELLWMSIWRLGTGTSELTWVATNLRDICMSSL